MRIATQKMYDYAQAISDRLRYDFKGYEYDEVSAFITAHEEAFREAKEYDACKELKDNDIKTHRVVFVEFIEGYNNKSYIFEVPECYKQCVHKGAVLGVKTRAGATLVKAVSDCEIGSEELLKKLGAYFPLKKIIGVERRSVSFDFCSTYPMRLFRVIKK